MTFTTVHSVSLLYALQKAAPSSMNCVLRMPGVVLPNLNPPHSPIVRQAKA
jgi:hypothetical protein